MEIRHKKKLTIQLILNEEETDTMQSIMQNSYLKDLENEDPEMRTFRKEIFNGIRDAKRT